MAGQTMNAAYNPLRDNRAISVGEQLRQVLSPSQAEVAEWKAKQAASVAAIRATLAKGDA
jgi:hypothetical protein